MVELTFGEQVKIVLSRKGMTIKELAEIIQKRTGKKMSRQNLTQRLGRDNFQEQDMRMIAEILGCPFKLTILEDTNEAEQMTAHTDNQKKTVVKKKQPEKEVLTPSNPSVEREITIGELMDIHEELDVLAEEKLLEELAMEESDEAEAEAPYNETVAETADRQEEEEITGTVQHETVQMEEAQPEEVMPEEIQPEEVQLEEVQPEQSDGSVPQPDDDSANDIRDDAPAEDSGQEESMSEEDKRLRGLMTFLQRKIKKQKQQPEAETASDHEDITTEPDEISDENPDTWKEQLEQEIAGQQYEAAEDTESQDYEELEEMYTQEMNMSGDINPYTGLEYESNSVRMHPKRLGYVQVYDREQHAWTDMTEWAFLGYQERKKALLGKDYEPPIYLD